MRKNIKDPSIKMKLQLFHLWTEQLTEKKDRKLQLWMFCIIKPQKKRDPSLMRG